ncbi:Creatinine amidohydrolase [bacterium HR33]|nr:Creatinine amidohydrolase [bacterium HR33]
MNREIFLERMTWPQVKAHLESGTTTVVFACGAVEQHGPHLPLFTDAEHGTALAEKVARKLGNALVAPTVRVGCSEHHMHFPGTISLTAETLEAVCRDYCASLSRHGFRTICIIPSHGGNFAPLEAMKERLREAVVPGTEVLVYTDLPEVIEIWRRVVQEASGLGDRVGGHADIAESSVMLALHPGLVRQEEAAPGCTEPVTPEFIRRIISEGFHKVSPNGIIGDARGLSAEIGHRCIDALADTLAEYFATARSGP